MYYVLIVEDSEAWSHSHEEYKVASRNKMMLETLKKEIEIMNKNLNCSVEMISLNNFDYVSYSYSDWNYSLSKNSGLGLPYDDLLKLERKTEKEFRGDSDDCLNCGISTIKLTDGLTRKERYKILEEIGFSDVCNYLEGYKHKQKAIKNGNYYMNPKKYDNYKRLFIN